MLYEGPVSDPNESPSIDILESFSLLDLCSVLVRKLGNLTVEDIPEELRREIVRSELQSRLAKGEI
jgi:hypothetical protein